MKLLETSYLVDYEKGRDVARAYYEAHDRDVFTASTVSAFELAVGVVQGSDRGVDELRESLRWVDFLEFTVADAVEGARVDGELQATGEPIPVGDTMIAGVARNRGATLVTGDDHFERVDGLDVETYRS